jgi:hypothetical protein
VGVINIWSTGRSKEAQTVAKRRALEQAWLSRTACGGTARFAGSATPL